MPPVLEENAVTAAMNSRKVIASMSAGRIPIANPDR